MDKEIIKIIIVEDDKALQDMYKSSIEEYNAENEKFDIEAFHLSDDKDIPRILYKYHIDAMIIDLDWGTGIRQNEGNQLVRKVYKDCRIPIFIVSGNLHLLEEDYADSPIFKKYNRDEIYNSQLFDEIEKIYSTGYTKVLGNQSELDRMLSNVFWKHMCPVIGSWDNKDKDFKTQRMLRFAVTRMNEMLNIDSSDNHDDYDALEFYIKPAIKDKPFTGDIIDYENKKYVVITAACDMEQKKLDYVVVCKIDFDEFDNIRKEIKENKKKAEERLKRFINNAVPRYHLLPPCKLFSGGLIDFQQVENIKKEKFYENSIVKASINPVFHKDIQARFSHYYGRQGQPQLNKEDIVEWIKEN